jgi:cytochrome c oxidase subunit 2
MILTHLPTLLPQIQDPLAVLPPAASNLAPDVDNLLHFINWVCVVLFLLITGVLVYAVIKWRRRHPDQPAASNFTHNTPLEVTWTVVPLVIVMVFFAWGWKGSLEMTVAPADSLQYQVVGKQWFWTVTHPKGQMKVAEMWVPADSNVKVTLYSNDVLHSFFVPAFRVKRDVLPGRYQYVWFRARMIDPSKDVETHDMFCTEYCGQDHSYMVGKVHVVRADLWATGKYPPKPADPLAYGQQLYNSTCIACHSTDGTPRVGPTFKGLWGKEEVVVETRTKQEKTVTVDRAYLKESLHDPDKVKPKGLFEALTMTSFANFGEDEIDAMQKFLETLK